MKTWIGRIASWMIVLATIAVLAAAVLVPRIAGATPYTVMTGSMRPSLPPGALVVVRPTTIGEITIGDVITYQLESGEPAVVTHRVVGIGVDGAGETVLQTQGDANPDPDENPVRNIQIRGEAWYAVPYLGWLNKLLDSTQRQWAVYAIAALLIGYAIVLWTGALRDRVRTHQNGDDTDAEHAQPASA